MITEQEITQGKEVPEAYKADLKILIAKINIIRSLYGKPMTVTSGFRTWNEHLNIYKNNAHKKGIPFYLSQVPTKSNHLYCRAVDIYDPKQELQKWCLENQEKLKEIGVWLEERQGNWQHIQIVPFGSYKKDGTIFFKP